MSIDDDVSTKMKRPAISIAPGDVFALAVMSGPQRGARYLLDGCCPARVLVGTSEACHLRLEDRHVSRRHIAIDVGEPLVARDLGSKNGTLVNGVSVIEVALRGGETIDIGETSLRVELAPAASARPTSTEVAFGRLLGASPEMRRMYPLAAQLAQSDVPIVIEGETGTGKEVLAESLHEKSARAEGPFVVFDCTTVSSALLESELFGHERGAFTGAVAMRRGVFEQADGGTLMIDEIGDLELPLQAKLLRALERSEIRRVGGTGFINVDVRVIAATRRDLDREVQAGHFRDDLFYRLAVGRLELPALRRRTGDARFLAQHFFRQAGVDPSTVPYDVYRKLESYDWPGNVRELSNAIARHVAIGDLVLDGSSPGPRASSAHAHDETFDEILAMGLSFPRARDLALATFERRYVERVLAEHGGNVAHAAEASGIARRYFQMIRARQRGGSGAK